MAQLANAGSEQDLLDPIVRSLVMDLPQPLSLDTLDQWIRNHYDYRPEDEEVIRTPNRMWEDFATTNRFQGDCDDISTFYASILISLGYDVRFVAIRSNASNPEFEHVYVEAWDGLKWRVFDPTVPLGTPYHIVERMEQAV